MTSCASVNSVNVDSHVTSRNMVPVKVGYEVTDKILRT